MYTGEQATAEYYKKGLSLNLNDSDIPRINYLLTALSNNPIKTRDVVHNGGPELVRNALSLINIFFPPNEPGKAWNEEGETICQFLCQGFERKQLGEIAEWFQCQDKSYTSPELTQEIAAIAERRIVFLISQVSTLKYFRAMSKSELEQFKKEAWARKRSEPSLN
jgi:hypothetical protein